MSKTYLAVPFETKNAKYIFDGVTSEVIPSSDLLENILKNYYKYSKDDLYNDLSDYTKDEFEHTYSYASGMIEEGMFYMGESEFPKGKSIKEQALNGSGSQLILVLTEECNMRCEYCVYSDKYPHEIGYSNIEMNFDIAKKAVDEFLELHNKRVKNGYLKPPFICFYGGEPLLKFDLIKEVVEYVDSIRSDAVYYITTNGLLMNDDVAGFISKHNFNTTFSLDGFKENHDRNRVTVGGKQTFDVIYRNIINFMKKKKEEHAEQLTSFNCCYDNYTNIYECIKFFEDNYDLFSPFYVTYAPVKPYDTSYYDWVKEYMATHDYDADEDEFRKSIRKVKELFYSDKEGLERFREIATSLFVGNFTFMIRNKWSHSEYNNSCTPLDKLAVYPDGNYVLCEKMNSRLPIGNVDTGLDFDKVQEVADMFKENFKTKKCRTCPVRTTCSTCFMYMNDEGKFDEEFCEETRANFRKRLEEMYDLKEQGIDFLDVTDLNRKKLEIMEVMN